MASLSTDAKGNRTIQFTAADGKRRSVRLGKLPIRKVESIKAHVEHLNAAALSGMAADGETAAWLAKVGDVIVSKLAAVGLVSARKSATLGAFLDDYIAGRTDVAKRTTWNLEIVARRMKEHFGADLPLRDITAGDADAFVIWMKSEEYATATTARTIKRAKQFFQAAVRAKLLTENPFAGIKPGSMANEERKAFVSRDNIKKVLSACPDAEWRLIVALSRFGGLRCPSETFVLTWADVLWDQDRFIVRSPKTGTRTVPIFPELRPYLEACFDAAPPGTVHVVATHRNANLRTRMVKIIERAGLKVWPKPFHNLRASRQTELAAEFPIHVVCEWIGNSAAIAQAHYLQVTDGDFDRAAKSGAKSGAIVVQKAVQTAFDRNEQELPNLSQVLTGDYPGTSLSYIGNLTYYPQGDSNPCLSREKAMS